MESPITQEAKDDHHFQQLYHTAFGPFVRAPSDDEIKQLVSATTIMMPDHLQGGATKHVTGSCISAQQAAGFLNLILQPGCTWQEIVTLMTKMNQEMTSMIRQCIGLENAAAGPKPESAVVFLIFSPDSKASFFTCPLVGGNSFGDKGSAVLTPDEYHYRGVRLAELNERCSNYGAQPSGRSLICVLEGICYWSQTARRYYLIFPLCCLRRLFLLHHNHVSQVAKDLLTALRMLGREATYSAICDPGIMERCEPAIWAAISDALRQRDFILTSNKAMERLEQCGVTKYTMTLSMVLAVSGPWQCIKQNCIKRHCIKTAVRTRRDGWRESYCNSHIHTSEFQCLVDQVRCDAREGFEQLQACFQTESPTICISVKVDGADHVIQFQRIPPYEQRSVQDFLSRLHDSPPQKSTPYNGFNSSNSFNSSAPTLVGSIHPISTNQLPESVPTAATTWLNTEHWNEQTRFHFAQYSKPETTPVDRLIDQLRYGQNNKSSICLNKTNYGGSGGNDNNAQVSLPPSPNHQSPPNQQLPPPTLPSPNPAHDPVPDPSFTNSIALASAESGATVVPHQPDQPVGHDSGSATTSGPPSACCSPLVPKNHDDSDKEKNDTDLRASRASIVDQDHSEPHLPENDSSSLHDLLYSSHATDSMLQQDSHPNPTTWTEDKNHVPLPLDQVLDPASTDPTPITDNSSDTVHSSLSPPESRCPLSPSLIEC
jgi:hypothetical protein